MKNMKVKKLSKGILLGFFVFQFVFGTSFAPIIANAQEVAGETNASDEKVLGVEESENQENEEVSSFGNPNNGGGHTQVQICHAAGQSGNYLILTVDDDGTYGGHGNHQNDIIPITDLNNDGQITVADCGYVPNPPTPTGSITVCKIITSGVGHIFVEDWGNIPTANTFTVNFLPKPGILNSSFNEAGIPAPIVFDTNTDNTNALMYGSWGGNASCKTINNLALGGYFYGQEVIAGDSLSDWQIKGYNDGFDIPVQNNSSLKNYDNTLFVSGDFPREMNADGHVVLTQQRPNRTIVIRNHYIHDIDKEDPKNTPPVITVNPEEVQVLVGANCNEAFILNGVTANDTEDGNITSEIIYSGNVDCDTPGTYEVCYNVTDSGKLPAEEKCRTIIVIGEDPEGPSCDVSTIWARIVITDVQSAGMGNITNNIYLGGNNPGNVVSSGVWFPLSAVSDSNINGYQNVPGLAVQRTNDNKIVVHLHGSLPQNQGRESVDGYIEFFNGTPTLVVGATGQNKLEDATYPHEDLVWIVGDRSYFDLAVSTANDRFTTTYIYSLDEDCDDGDDDDDNGGCIGEDCNTDDDDDDDDNGGNNGGNSSSSGSRGGRGGGFIPEGEVLGATDSVCVQFTQYHDTGSRKSEVVALQTFLNEYMNAGLVVNGIYDWATTQAIHNFQALHWDAIIKPWLGGPSKISPNTTGRTRQMTTQALNFIMNCPNDEMYLEDPKIFYKLTEIKNKKEFTADQIMKVSNLLEIAKGVVLGVEVMGK